MIIRIALTVLFQPSIILTSDKKLLALAWQDSRICPGDVS
jgi:hypothetical protein